MSDTETFRATPPEVSDTRRLQLPQLREHTLPSGIRMLIYDRCDSPVNYLSIITPGGQAEASSPAIPALTAIMLREGSASFSGSEIASTLDFNGSWLRSTPCQHDTQISVFSMNRCLPQVLPVIKDILTHPTFPSEEFNVRRESLARNIEISMEDVSYLARCLSDRMIMGASHPLATTDTPQQVRALTPTQVAAFHQKHIDAGKATVFLCGDITDEVERTVAEAFSDITPRTGNEAAKMIKPFRPVPPESTERINVSGASQSAVILTLPAIPRSHPHYIPLHLTVAALGGYFGSRLMLNIREEKGLTYGINAALIGYTDGAHIQISAETDNANVGALIDEVRSEMLRLASDPCRGDELIRMRRASTSSLAAVLDSPFATIDYHISMHTSGIPHDYFDNKYRAIQNLTPDTIAEMARQYLRPELLRTAIAGDISKMQA